MHDAEDYLDGLIRKLKEAFGDRLVYVGLQDRSLLDETADPSGIDPMVVIDQLTRKDLATYRSIAEQLPDPEIRWDFPCGRDELAHWNPLEVNDLLHTTHDKYGTLATLVPAYDEHDRRLFIRQTLCRLHRELCYRYVRDRADTDPYYVSFISEAAALVLQDLHQLRTGIFCRTKRELLAQLTGDDLAVMQLSIKPADDLGEAFDLLLGWCQQTLASL